MADNDAKAADNDAKGWTPEDYDKEIKRLRQERDKLQNMIDNPNEKKQRSTRRAQLIGEYAIRSVFWDDAHMAGIRQVAAKTEEEWLFGTKLLQLDGWRHDKGNWHPPKV